MTERTVNPPARWFAERWERPSLILIALMWAAALLMMTVSGIRDIPPFIALIPNWMLLAGTLTLVSGFVWIVRMMLRGEERPLARIAGLDWTAGSKVAFWSLLGGLHMVAFMSIKPQLNYLVPFWADPLLADLDALLMFGDPWRWLQWMNNAATADYYHRGWFLGVVAVLLWQLSRPASRDKAANLLAYFAIWASGPLIHVLLPAGGPIFYEALGHGDRFVALVPPKEIQDVAAYLWRTYTEREFAMGAGISAMPSLHIATVTWVVLCCRGTRWIWLAWAYALSTFALSVSLGWHYAVDGVLGALVAWVIVVIARRASFLEDEAAAVSGDSLDAVARPV